MASREEYLAAAKLLACTPAPFSLTQMEDIMLGLTRHHWAHPDNHGTLASMFECAVYDFAKPDVSTMPVELQDAYHEEDLKKPGIYIGGLEAPFGKLAVGNAEGYSDDNATRNSIWRCNTGILAAHVNTSARLAKAAAESTLAFWCAIGQTLMARLGLIGFDPQRISAAAKLDKSPVRMYRVDAVVQIVFTWGVSVSQESHRLKLLMSQINPTPNIDS